MVLPVKSLRTVITLLMVAIWPVAVIHCRLESLPGLEFLHCASDSPGKSDCDDGCATVETATYKAPDFQTVVPDIVSLSLLISVWASVDLNRTGAPSGLLSSALPEPLPSWQFSSRVAPPIRAPSFVS
jgi:hypothetical protein